MKTRMKRKNQKKSLLLPILLVFGLGIISIACVQQASSGHRMEDALGKIASEAKEILRQSSSVSLSSGFEMPAIREDVDTRILSRTGYTLSYNDEWKIPNWVAWQLTDERVKGRVKRSNEFFTDEDLPVRYRSEHRDYSGSRYDRGHMVPAGDMKWDEQAMKESFYMSNMCPQAPNLNKGDWRILEEQCRKWAQRYGTLFIACGPIVDKRLSSKKRIGRSKVLVPDGFFKVVLKMGRKPSAIGFVFPNDDCNQPLMEYAMSVDDVEELTGIDFFHYLPDDQEEMLEAQKVVNW